MDRQEYETYDTMEREDSASSVKKVTSFVWKLLPVAYMCLNILLHGSHYGNTAVGHVAWWAFEKKVE